MWVRLTSGRLRAVDDMAGRSSNNDLRDALHLDRRWDSPTRCEVNAPYIAWAQVRDLFLSYIFTPIGSRRGGVKSTWDGALKLIVTAMNRIDKHPALRGAAMLGHHAEMFPVWEQPVDKYDRLWSPTPLVGARFYVLGPRWETEGQKVTTWAPISGTAAPYSMALLAHQDPLLEERPHIRLVRV